jgi:hypothetical protein
MDGSRTPVSLRHKLGSLGRRLIGLADEPTDDDDLRLRKRVGVVAGWIGVVLPLQLPGLAQGHPVSWWVALTMPLVSAGNLAVLARSRRFDRYVVILVLTFMLMPAFVEVALGGLAGSSANIVFAFLGPVYAILALGPRRATAWFIFFLVILAVAAIFLVLGPNGRRQRTDHNGICPNCDRFRLGADGADLPRRSTMGA